MIDFDQDTLDAAVDLVGRSGAKQFEIGYLHDEGEPEYEEKGACWYAHVTYRGARLREDDHKDPIAACEALARRLLTGAKCKCGKLVALSDEGAIAYPVTKMADGSEWTAKEAAAVGQCRWRRVGPRWVSACGRTGER